MQNEINTKVVGVTFDNKDGVNRQEVIKTLKVGQPLNITAEPDNPFDTNCQKVETLESIQIGNLKKELAVDIAKGRLNGWKYRAKITALTGGEEDRIRGVNILLIAEQ